MRGYFGIGIFNGKTEVNIGTLWRSAHAFGASFIFTINRRYKKQASDTTDTARHVPMTNYPTLEDFFAHLPYNCRLVGVEVSDRSDPIEPFVRPERAVYLLGAEDAGLPQKALEKCHHIIHIPSHYCLNVAVAGSIVMYDRNAKRELFSRSTA